MKKRILALMLVLCLMAGIVPAYAEDAPQAAPSVKFDDVTDGHPAFEAVTFLAENGIINGKIRILCAKGSINVLKVLPEGKGRMSSADFIRGRKVNEGDLLR